VNAKTYCTVSGSLFILLGVLHIWRFVADMPVQLGNFSVARNLSIVGMIVALGLGVWGFKSASQIPPAL